MTAHEPVVTVETVTPELAAEWLVGNTHNRTMKDRAVTKYAADMAAGLWDVNGESIKFNGDGRLLDGQNRLQAVVVAGVPIQTVVVRGIAAVTQETIDVGVPRTLADVLKLRGEVSCSDLASAVSALWRFQRNPEGMATTDYPSVHTALAVLEQNPGLRDSVREAFAFRKAIGLRSGVGVPLHYITTSIDAEDAEAFWSRLTSGADLESDDPIFVLRAAVLADRPVHKQKMTKTRLWALTVKAWNAYRDGRKVRLLVWRPGGARPEAFPVPA
jgi:hypothetical protein